MLAGIFQKPRMRSVFYWFMGLCSSKCFLHFAAPFMIVVDVIPIDKQLEVLSHHLMRDCIGYGWRARF